VTELVPSGIKQTKMRRGPDFQTVSGGREIVFKEALGEAVFVGILYAIAYGCFLICIVNLLFVRPLAPMSLLASLVWIALVVAVTLSGCRKTGRRQYFVNTLAGIVRNRFAEFASDDCDKPVLSFGYKFGATRHYFLKLRPEGIVSVDWGPGQGNTPGWENQWNVAMWFDTGSVVFDGSDLHLGIFIVGPTGRKAGREAFGAAFIEFLKANDVQIVLPSRELLGQVGEVIGPFRPLGRIRIGHDEYVAHALKWPIEIGSLVTVEEIRGTVVYVRERNGPDKPSETTP
jgi:hypothetical protein